MNIYESAEDYLESILVLRMRRGSVKSIDVAQERGFSKPSVSRAVKNLKANGYIKVDEKGFITLLPKGEEIAQRIYERHRLFSDVLIRLGVDEETAYRDACKIEHTLSPESFEKIKEYVEKHMK